MELRRTISSAVLLSAVLAGGLALAGCDDNVEVIRDPQIHITKGMTWAWRPPASPDTIKRGPDGRPINSRDVIRAEAPPPTQRLESNRDWNTEANRTLLQTTIENALRSRGLVQVSDPAVADLLVDYHVAVSTQSATVQRVSPGFYPVCGPFGCWASYVGWGGWGWGPPEVGFQNIRWRQGIFVLDIALRNPRKLAYRAISHRDMGNGRPTISPFNAEEAIGRLLKGLKVS